MLHPSASKPLSFSLRVRMAARRNHALVRRLEEKKAIQKSVLRTGTGIPFRVE